MGDVLVRQALPLLLKCVTTYAASAPDPQLKYGTSCHTPKPLRRPGILFTGLCTTPIT